MSTEEPRSVLLEEVSHYLSCDPFWTIRAKAIQAYATLEQSLCQMLAHVGNMDREVAGIIFFKISNSDARTKIIEKLFRRKHNQQFRPFINSLVTQLRTLDIKRNEIVHWNTVELIAGDQKNQWSLALMPPNFWTPSDKTLRIEISDLISFSRKCEFYSRMINM